MNESVRLKSLPVHQGHFVGDIPVLLIVAIVLAVLARPDPGSISGRAPA